jgi:hypothetical protein
MFQRGEPHPSDPHLSHIYGLALPLLKSGIPVEPVQLENAPLPKALDRYRVLFLTYHGQKPMSPAVHAALARWVKAGGTLVVVDDDSDPYNKVREWWNQTPHAWKTPRHHLFAQFGLPETAPSGVTQHGQGRLAWYPFNPALLATRADGKQQVLQWLRAALAGEAWQPQNHLLLRRGPYLIAAGLDESIDAPLSVLKGRFINLFDPDLALQTTVAVDPGSRRYLLDLDELDGAEPQLLAAACKAWPGHADAQRREWTVEGIADTQAIMVFRLPEKPTTITLADSAQPKAQYNDENQLLYLRFPNTAEPRKLSLRW